MVLREMENPRFCVSGLMVVEREGYPMTKHECNMQDNELFARAIGDLMAVGMYRYEIGVLFNDE